MADDPQAAPLLLPLPREVVRVPGIYKEHSDKPPIARIDPTVARPQGYSLSVAPNEIRIIGNDPTGLENGRRTVAQLRLQYGRSMPCMEILDWPDFPIRGVMLDISRDKVPSIATLEKLIDLLARWKINHLQLYIEHTFAYAGHEEVWRDSGALTAAEIQHLDAYCAARGIELAPNQNSFGHMERWLNHPRYLPLAEAPDGSDTPWGYRWEGPFSLSPTNPGSVALLADLYGQLLPNFSSKWFNVGCDETFDIGQGASKDAVRQRGAGRVYLEFLQKVAALVHQRDHKMMFWGDIIVKHPELIPELPPNVTSMLWGYEATSPLEAEAKQFKAAGVPFFICPGTSSWCSITGRTDNMLGNIAAACAAGRNHGAMGILNTDWGDHGHLQYLPFSYPGFAAGAAMSWCTESNANLPLAKLLDLHAFSDKGGMMGQAVLDLGNVYRSFSKLHNNSSTLFRILQHPKEGGMPADQRNLDDLDRARTAIRAAKTLAGQARMRCDDAALISREFANASAMLGYACDRGNWLLDKISFPASTLDTALGDILDAHRALWLARNREGGLRDSAARLEALRIGTTMSWHEAESSQA
jgi:hexosaminidase